VTVEDCHVHDTTANAISANDAGVDYAGIVLRRNHIHDTGGNGEGMYLGCNDAAWRVPRPASSRATGSTTPTAPRSTRGDGI
jgi:hypothetical protein